ncbi:MAG: BsaWI family type II restriction enzyme [Elusimicrobiota bacterium]|jgi:type II restriction enzyme|nr:BsaWI family type II restriction enzyme [Elusimicrobiota bacterium]
MEEKIIENHKQSWQSLKNNTLHRFVEYIVADMAKDLKLGFVTGNKIRFTVPHDLTAELNKIKRNLLVDYGGEYDARVPNMDIVIYEPKSSKVFAIVFMSELKERVLNAVYWKLKFDSCPYSNHIKVFFVTSDSKKFPTNNKFDRMCGSVLSDIDGYYVFSERKRAKNDNIQNFDEFFDDLQKAVK